MKIDKRHCFINRTNDKYVLINNGAPPENTCVNDQPVARTVELHDGDRLQLGNVLLRFQLRAAAERRRKRSAAPPVAVGIPVPRASGPRER